MKRLTKLQKKRLRAWIQLKAKNTKNTEDLHNFITVYQLLEEHEKLTAIKSLFKNKFEINHLEFKRVVTPRKGYLIVHKKKKN